MKRMISLLSLFLGLILWPNRPVFADNTYLSAVCTNVDCLNNFTAKTGYSIAKDKVLYGGFTDMKQDWYLSPGPGFDAAQGETPNLDINLIFKAGKLLADRVPYFHDFVSSHPFTQGLLKYTTIGETGAYDYTHGKWYDLTWVGATVQF